MIDSELYQNSKNFIREIKAHMESPLLTELWGDWKGPTWSEGEIIIKQRTVNKKEPSILAAGVGTTKVGIHTDFIVMDDLNSGNNSATPEACEKVWRHYQMNTSILEPEGTIVVIGTRYSEIDVPGRILNIIKEDASDI